MEEVDKIILHSLRQIGWYVFLIVFFDLIFNENIVKLLYLIKLLINFGSCNFTFELVENTLIDLTGIITCILLNKDF